MDGYNRAKTSSAPTSANPATGIPPNKLTSIQNDDAKDKEGSVNGSEGGSDEGGASSSLLSGVPRAPQVPSLLSDSLSFLSQQPPPAMASPFPPALKPLSLSLNRLPRTEVPCQLGKWASPLLAETRRVVRGVETISSSTFSLFCNRAQTI
jgi:hypothetical protein